MDSKAFKAGKLDGREWCHDQDVDRGSGRRYEDGLNKPGRPTASIGLLDACGGKLLADVLGLTLLELDMQGIQLERACVEYDMGWDAAINKAISQRDADE